MGYVTISMKNTIFPVAGGIWGFTLNETNTE